MSATIGTCTARTIVEAPPSTLRPGDGRSAPAASSALIWRMVAFASEVSVFVIDCTVIGASPPTSTLPTRILRLFRRAMSR
jgi:hypothetical protein